MVLFAAFGGCGERSSKKYEARSKASGAYPNLRSSWGRRMTAFEEAEAHFRVGLAAKDVGDHQQAQSEFRACIDVNPGHALAHQELGWLIYGTSGPLPEAREHLGTAVELDPAL